jgi:hypothetical protein
MPPLNTSLPTLAERDSSQDDDVMLRGINRSSKFLTSASRERLVGASSLMN